MSAVIRACGALTLSIGLHLIIAALFVWSIAPRPPPGQPDAPVAFDLESHSVPQSRAVSRQAATQNAPQQQAGAAGISDLAIPTGPAEALALPQRLAAARDAAGVAAAVNAPTSSEAAPARRQQDTATAMLPQGATLRTRQAGGTVARQAGAPALSLRADAPSDRIASPESLPQEAAIGRPAVATQANAVSSALGVEASPPLADPAPGRATSPDLLAALPAQATTVIARADRPASFLSAAPPRDAPARAAAPQVTAAAAFPPASQAAAAAAVPVQFAAPGAPPAETAQATPAIARDMRAVPAPVMAASEAPSPAPEAPHPPRTASLASQPPPSAGLAPAALLAARASARSPPADRQRAALAWSGENAAVDPVTLAAITAFTRPGDPGSQSARLRDELQDLLGAVPCARLQTRFLPKTGTLELIGHVPDPRLRAPVLSALRAQVGGGIAVEGNVQVLPRPLCGILSELSASGLAQSTAQLNDPRIVGPDTHARTFRFRGGDALGLELTAADYDAFIHIDYFDSAGQVIHLQPNEIVPPRRIAAQTRFAIGAGAPGARLDLRVAPPYGEEIVVAFAASAPLELGARPLVEPAGPYLRDMAREVAARRAADPQFKGEWVYFLVETRAP